MHINKLVFESLQQIKGISGASILNDMGEILYSTIEESEINELASFLAAISPTLATDEHLGEVNKITLKSPNDENLIIHMIDDKIIVSTSPRKISCAVISHKIESLLNEYNNINYVTTLMNAPSSFSYT